MEVPHAIAAFLRDGQTIRFVARGSSMWPFVRDGAVVEAVPCAAGDLCPGELGVYEREGGIVVHRVVAGGFLGDAHAGPPQRVPPERVLGRARVVTQPRPRLRVPSLRELAILARAALRRF